VKTGIGMGAYQYAPAFRVNIVPTSSPEKVDIEGYRDSGGNVGRLQGLTCEEIHALIETLTFASGYIPQHRIALEIAE
jgi:hypothetical protein